MSEERNEHGSPLLVIGALLVVIGAWLMIRQFGLVPEPVLRVWAIVRDARGALALILVGVAVIVMAGRGGKAALPEKGKRLYRSRDDRWISGVLGGLAKYFGIDAVALRVAFLALALLTELGTAIVAYIILSMVMPEEPKPMQASPTKVG